MGDNIEKLWTLEDVADFCRVKPSVIRYWISNESLPCMKIGKYLRFDPGDVLEWIECRKERQKWTGSELARVQ